MHPLYALELDGSEPISATAVKAVSALCDRAEDAEGTGARSPVVAVHVTGAPDDGWAGSLDVMLVTKWERALRRLERLPVATVAVAHGDCGGTALETFLAADVRVATPDTRLLLPRDATATWPGMAGYRLVRLAGVARTRGALLFGRPVQAAEALALGVVDELTDDPAAAVAAAAALVGDLSGKEIAIRRQLMFDAATTGFEDALGAHLAACDRALRQGAAPETAAEA
ncbi:MULTISPECIES: enoyl-CoA-hydratase DpgB [unclassified Streptomyces]|nr:MULTISPECIES: enoyl-CoA-hydratase DpgB [unclassified Streptomyces]MYZ14396.1 enoyl-CoA hydratase/isomerase family protein [Streptomyces sp. SID337]NEB43993.1 enoyl-CoA hydratase/isomerase family protein [Streptomyces sp. SID339]